MVSRLAGNGTEGYSGDGGPAVDAEINTNWGGITVDNGGNVVFADAGNQRIREINMSTGIISTIAGDGSQGTSGNGGAATSAELDNPVDIAFDSAGNMYFAEASSYDVREVNHSTGDISIVAGNGTEGYSGDGYPAIDAEFTEPWGIAIDSAGDLYVSDSGAGVVRKIDHSTGDISTYAGNGEDGDTGDGGPAVDATFRDPTDIALDSSGNLFIEDSYDSDVREVNAESGVISNTVTSYEYLLYPYGLAVNSLGEPIIANTSDFVIDVASPYGEPPLGGAVLASQRYGGGGGVAPGTCDCRAGDPVDVATGDFTQSATDASIPTYGPPLSFSRTYDAVSAQQEAATSSPGPMGYGWMDNWSTSLSLNTDYDTSVSGDVTFNQANGSQALFVSPVDDACQSPYVGSGDAGTYCNLPRVLGSLSYDSGDSTHTLVEDPGTTYTFNASGKVTSISDANGESETVTYNSPSPGSGHCPDSASSCELITSASGRTLTMGWSGSEDSGTITSVTDPMGRRTTYDYSSGNLITVTDPLDRVTSYSYDSSNETSDLKHDLLTVTDPDAQSGGPDAGDVLTNTYNDSGQVTSQADPMGRVTSFDFTNMDGATLDGSVIETDPDGNETEFLFDEGLLVRKTTGYDTDDPRATTYVIDPAVLLDDSVVDAYDDATSYSYDADGNVLTRSNARGNTWSYSYNDFNEPTCAAEPMSTEQCSSLSPPSAVTAGTSTITPPDSAPPRFVTYYAYDTDGNLIYQTTGDYGYASDTASQSRTTYDLYDGQSVTLDDVEDSCTTSAPSSELPCATINADGVVTQLTYDDSGDIASISTPDGNADDQLSTTSYGYDDDGERTSEIAPDGNVADANVADFTTVTTYNDDGEPTAVTQGGGEGATVTARTVDYGYDADGNETSVDDARGYTTDYTYDADDEATLVTDPDDSATLTCYDGDGNVAETVPAVSVADDSLTPSSCPTDYPSDYGDRLADDATTYAYNALNEKAIVTSPAPPGLSGYETTTYAYDLDGRLTSMTAPPTSNGDDAPND
ncbi:MAG: DUF6531 domain-containing protein, partial [Acidimicrobiales bacterium]